MSKQTISQKQTCYCQTITTSNSTNKITKVASKVFQKSGLVPSKRTQLGLAEWRKAQTFLFWGSLAMPSDTSKGDTMR